ncbi:MAG: hypothetical protein AB9846_06110 [Tenuifilaceae bacterium]
MKHSYYSLLFLLVLFSPLINSIADTTIKFFDLQEGFFHLGLLRGFVIVLAIVIFLIKYGIILERVSLIIFSFLIYLLILLPSSSDFFYSLSSGYLKWFSSLLLFPLGVYFFRTPVQLNKLSQVVILASIPIVINIIIAQIFKIGKSAYLEESFYYGGANIGITNMLTIILLFIPIYFITTKNKSRIGKVLIIILVLLSLFSIVMIMKRAAIIGLGIGFSVYLLFSKQKIKQLRLLALVTLIGFLSMPFYIEKLEVRITARTEEKNQIENEARYHEVFYVIKEFKEGELLHKFFGTEPFNSRQFFGPKYFNKGRMIHGDLSSFFYGTGLVGLTMYILIFITIGIQAIYFLKKFFHSHFERELIAVLLGILSCGFFITTTGSGTVGEKGIMYLCMGAIIGVLRSSYLERRMNNNVVNNQYLNRSSEL